MTFPRRVTRPAVYQAFRRRLARCGCYPPVAAQFRRRQVSSRIATFAEAFSSIGWAATAALAAVSLPLAIPPGLIALALVIGTRLLAPRQGA